MRVDWDPAKAESNFHKHGVPFKLAERAFSSRIVQWRDRRRDYGEERWCGSADIDGRIHIVVFTILGIDHVRLISARKANAREKRAHRSETDTPQAPDGVS